MISSILRFSSNLSSTECCWYALSIFSTSSISMLISESFLIMYSFNLSEFVRLEILSKNTRKDCGDISCPLFSRISFLKSAKCFKNCRNEGVSRWETAESVLFEMLFEINFIKSSHALTACSFSFHSFCKETLHRT